VEKIGGHFFFFFLLHRKNEVYARMSVCVYSDDDLSLIRK